MEIDSQFAPETPIASVSASGLRTVSGSYFAFGCGSDSLWTSLSEFGWVKMSGYEFPSACVKESVSVRRSASETSFA